MSTPKTDSEKIAHIDRTLREKYPGLSRKDFAQLRYRHIRGMRLRKNCVLAGCWLLFWLDYAC